MGKESRIQDKVVLSGIIISEEETARGWPRLDVSVICFFNSNSNGNINGCGV